MREKHEYKEMNYGLASIAGNPNFSDMERNWADELWTSLKNSEKENEMNKCEISKMTATKVKKCKSCESIVVKTFKYCPECGYKFETEQQSTDKPESCDKCKYKSQCKRPDRIDNAYGGLECATKWHKQPESTSEARKAFEKTDQYKNAHSKEQINDRFFIFSIGYVAHQDKSQAEIEELKVLINNIENCLICADIGDNREIIENSYSMIINWKQK